MDKINKGTYYYDLTQKIATRVSKDIYYFDIAEKVAARGTCLRTNYGAVIVNNDEIVSTGYTGSPRKCDNCIDIGSCYRIDNDVPSGQQYEKCKSVHAEMNAMLSASRNEMLDSTLYLVGIKPDGTFNEDSKPCTICKRMIVNAGIKYVFVKCADDYGWFYDIKDSKCNKVLFFKYDLIENKIIGHSYSKKLDKWIME